MRTVTAVDELFVDLDDSARIALDVALGTAAALGDRQCGTEYLLLGIFATAKGEMAEVGELFVLDELRIERAIQKLRPEYRACIMLRHVEGRSYEEIAATLDLPLGTVKTYIHRARHQLRDALEGLRE